MQHSRYSNQGFTVLELVVALIVLVILLAIAYPSYHDSVIKSRRAEARAALHSTLLLQESYYLQHNTYLAFDANTDNAPFKWWSGDMPATSYYEIHADACPNKSLSQCVLLTAVPGTDKVRSHIDPVCGNLMLDSANHKSYSTGSDPNSACW